ncbi:MAG: DNA alkylation repair protein [Lentisphaeria bacterium]|nr:DNA alkylation repair protein [Lentisphaeria bacterium]NQZ67280.1 DNA alkylation repair protein [Lentisphaeria bacterium]
MSEQKLMKDSLGKDALKRIARSFKKADPKFPADKFLKDASKGLNTLELKARVHHCIAVLHDCLPKDYSKAAKTLLKVKAHWDRGDLDDPNNGFAAWPVIDYTGVYGLEHPELALKVLKNLTSLFSAEFAIRPFLIEHQALTLKTIRPWLTDPDHHVRRLVSEGTRPRLPWGQQLPAYIKDPGPIFPLLEKLKDDPTDYVYRSVANNLNDISKDHPDLVIQRCLKWQKNASPERQWLIRHALRTLIKAGHPDVFPLLGYTKKPKIELSDFGLSADKIKMGKDLNFEFTLASVAKSEQSIVLDYAIHFMKANGNQKAKVFKLKNLKIKKGESIEIQKKHSFKKISTRKFYPGAHKLVLLINGKEIDSQDFCLIG